LENKILCREIGRLKSDSMVLFCISPAKEEETKGTTVIEVTIIAIIRGSPKSKKFTSET
jgi:hypothetical protein